MSLLLIAALLAQPASASSSTTFVPARELLQRARTAPEAGPGLQGASLVKTSDYSAIVIRRTAVERAEAHSGVADVWYVVEGGGTLVTGGSLVEGADTEPGEIRGRSIAGGEARHVGAGDFVAIPPGVPHWLSKIDGEIVYVVVKVPSRR